MFRVMSLAALVLGCTTMRAPPRSSNADSVATSARIVFVAQTPWAPWEHWRLERASDPALDVFLAHDSTKRPLVVLLQGSGCGPLFFLSDTGSGEQKRASSLFFGKAAEARLDRAHFVAIEKHGVRSFGPFHARDKERPQCSERYEARVDKPSRVRDVVDVIDALTKLPWVGPVLVAGHSEGADLATGVALALGQRLEAVGLFSSAGPSQLVDFAVYAHRTGDSDTIRETFVEIQHVIDAKEEAAQFWRGHSMRRWRSYAIDSTPLDEMRACGVPTFVAHGSRDTNSPVESADMFVVELMRTNPSRPIYYIRVQDADHGFQLPGGENHKDFVFDEFLNWGLSRQKNRRVLVGPPFQAAR
jgi:pimeloyl-ACP methyl ester carboxylesterase